MNLVVYIFFHRLSLVLVRWLSVGNWFCCQNHFSYKEKLHPLTEFKQLVRGTHIFRAIIFTVFRGMFLLVALLLLSSMAVWYVFHSIIDIEN